MLACAVSGQWSAPSTQPTGADIARQYQSQDGYGKASFGYSHPGQSAVTHRDAQGNQIGSYAYINPEGREIRVNYIADADGFRVDNNYITETAEVAAARSSHLAAHAAALAAAKAASPNQELWEETPQTKTVPVQRTYTAPVQQTYTAPVQQTWTAPVQQQTWTAPVQESRVAPDTNWLAPEQYYTYRPSQVPDTPEVQAAKAEFYRTYNEAAARAPKDLEPVAPKQQTWSAPVQQQTWSAPVQQQTWTAPVQTQTWTAPVQETRVAPDTNWLAPELHFSYRPTPVEDTPEVRAAKAQFYQSYNAAAALAAQQQQQQQQF